MRNLFYTLSVLSLVLNATLIANPKQEYDEEINKIPSPIVQQRGKEALEIVNETFAKQDINILCRIWAGLDLSNPFAENSTSLYDHADRLSTAIKTYIDKEKLVPLFQAKLAFKKDSSEYERSDNEYKNWVTIKEGVADALLNEHSFQAYGEEPNPLKDFFD